MTKAEMKQVLFEELEKSQARDDSDECSHQDWMRWGVIIIARELEIINSAEESELTNKYFVNH